MPKESAVVASPSKGQRTRRKVLDSASEVFSSLGFNDARMSDIASRADVSVGALYRYFPSKDQLFRAVLDDLERPVIGAAARQGLDFYSDPYAAMRAANLAYLEQYRAHPGIYASLRGAACDSAYYNARVVDARRRFRERILHVLHGLVRRSLVAPPADEQVLATKVLSLQCMMEELAYSLYGAPEGVGLAHEAGGAEPDIETTATTVTQIWCDVLRDYLPTDHR